MVYIIYANIGGILMVDVTIYSIHGSYGICLALEVCQNRGLFLATLVWNIRESDYLPLGFGDGPHIRTTYFLNQVALL
jgi:hypothetical protein